MQISFIELKSIESAFVLVINVDDNSIGFKRNKHTRQYIRYDLSIQYHLYVCMYVCMYATYMNQKCNKCNK